MSVDFWIDAEDLGPLEEPLRREFPAITAGPRAAPAPREVTIVIASWRRRSFDVGRLDADVAAAEQEGPFCLRIQGLDDPDGPPGEGAGNAVLEILTRYQRLAPRRSASSGSQWFRRALARHRALHDLRKPLVKADFDHAIDTWQWVLRLRPEASAAVQLAALFHDIERLWSEADARVEHLAADYQAFKDAHARAGAQFMGEALAGAGAPEQTLRRAAELVEAHERPSGDPELGLLNDADALSFFALNSWGFLNYYGLPHTVRKVEYTLGRMGSAARARLWPVRYHPAVERLIRDTLAEPRPGEASSRSRGGERQ